MTEAETAVREALTKMTPGEWRVLRDQCHFDTASDIACGYVTIAHTCSKYPQLEHDAAGIVALRNHTPALLAELDAARAEVARLREALKPFARLEVPTRAEGNCGFYSLLFRHIKDARAALEASHD